VGILLLIVGIVLFVFGILGLFRSIKWAQVKTWRAVLEIVTGFIVLLFAIFSFFS
jgi:hypothetical protein